MKCIVLAAGYATRLYPLTENFPKPLLTIGENTILDLLLDDIENSRKISEYIVVSNHKFAAHFEEWAKTKTLPITVLDDGTSTNETRLGAVKDIQYAIEQLHIEDDLLVIAGDNVLDFSLAKFVNYAAAKQASCIMRYYEPDFKKLLKCGVVTVGDDEKVLDMTEKSPTPATHWCCPPFYFYTKADAALLPVAIEQGCGTDAPGSFAAWVAKASTLYAMEMPGKRYDIGNLESYESVKANYKGII